MFDAYIRWEEGVGKRCVGGRCARCTCLSSIELVCCWTRSLVCTCMYVFCGVVLYACISDDIPNWSLRACRIEWYWHVDVFIYSSSLSLPTVYYTWYTCIQMYSRSCLTLPYLPTLHDESSSSSRKSQQYIYIPSLARESSWTECHPHAIVVRRRLIFYWVRREKRVDFFQPNSPSQMHGIKLCDRIA